MQRTFLTFLKSDRNDRVPSFQSHPSECILISQAPFDDLPDNKKRINLKT